MDYTIKNLREVEDAAVKFGFSETQEARFARKDIDAELTGLAYHVVHPDQRQAFAHHHDEAEEVYVVVAGSGRIKLGDEVRDIGRLDAIRVAPQVPRAFEAGSDGLELLAFGPHRPDDRGTMIEDFWED